MISASVAKGLSQQEMRFVIAVEVNCGIRQTPGQNSKLKAGIIWNPW